MAAFGSSGASFRKAVVGGDRRRRVAGLLGGLGQLELNVRVARLERNDLLVGGDGRARRSLGLRVERLERGRALGVERLADLVVDERLPGRRGEGAGEVLAGSRVGRLELNDLSLPLLLARLREVEARELAERVGILRRQHDDLILGVDRLVDLSLRLQGGRELAPRCDALRVLLGLLLRAC